MSDGHKKWYAVAYQRISYAGTFYPYYHEYRVVYAPSKQYVRQNLMSTSERMGEPIRPGDKMTVFVSITECESEQQASDTCSQWYKDACVQWRKEHYGDEA